MNRTLASLASRFGIMSNYRGLDGESYSTSADTQVALLSAMGVDASSAKAATESLRSEIARDSCTKHPAWSVVPEGTTPKLDIHSDEPWQLQLEDGLEFEGRGREDLPKLPLGRHRFTTGSCTTWLLSAPPKLPFPKKAWGVTGPLAGLKSPEEGGVGDYSDLGRAGLETAKKGAAFFGINPIHAGFPTDEKAFSPYSPSHRQWLNTFHISTDAQAASYGALIDYSAEAQARQAALRTQFETLGPSDAFEAYLAEKSTGLKRFATHQALSATFGPYWNTWPKALQCATAPVLNRIIQEMALDVQFHAWLQFQAETQLSAVADELKSAGMPFGLYLDLAVGTHPFGAETWENPDLFAKGASLGAPPDRFSPSGQSWNLAPFVPHAMEKEGFATFAAILRRQFQFSSLIRIDHILGFDRAFWSLSDANLAGAYVKMPLEALLAVTRIEATRANATVIGEDLGNIPPGLRNALKKSGILGCRIIKFEHDIPNGGGFAKAEAYDPQSLASFSTHDLPTWKGWRNGADIDARFAIGHVDAVQKSTAHHQRSVEVSAFDDVAAPRDMHTFLAETASQLVAVQIENVFDMEDQPNLPGTTVEYPNWRRRLPVAISDYATDPRLDQIATTMNSSGRGRLHDTDCYSDKTD